MSLDHVLASLRARLGEREAAKRAPAEAIAAALAAYVRAHELVLANALAERNGLTPVAGSSDVVAAALELRALVGRLPGLGGEPAAPVAEPAAAAPADAGATAAAPAPPSPPETLHDAALSLERDFQPAALAAMTADEFLLHADELAARARWLHERTGGDPVSLRVLRRLTALVRERGGARREVARLHGSPETLRKRAG